MSSRVQKHGEIILQNTRSLISLRYHTVTKAINKEFWNSTSDTLHSIYVGSYGRNTAIDTSDIDILVELPSSLFDRYNNLSGNSQSRLLQAVRNAILNTYPRSDVRADGQVVKIAFSDGMYRCTCHPDPPRTQNNHTRKHCGLPSEHHSLQEYPI